MILSERDTKFVISISIGKCHSQRVGGYSSKRALYEFCFFNPGIYSCAVDTFWKYLRTCFFHIYQIYELNGFTDLLFNVCSHYISSRGGRKGGPKTAKPHRNTPKNRKPHQIFSPNTETARTWRPTI